MTRDLESPPGATDPGERSFTESEILWKRAGPMLSFQLSSQVFQSTPKSAERIVLSGLSEPEAFSSAASTLRHFTAESSKRYHRILLSSTGLQCCDSCDHEEAWKLTRRSEGFASQHPSRVVSVCQVS